MSTPVEPPGAVEPRWRWLIWLAYTVAWTTALVVPVPDTPSWTVEELNIDLKFLVAKALHIGAYGLFAVLSGWLRVPVRYRWLLLFFVMAHGTATELIQLHVSSRTGCLEDVGFDQLGVGLGLLLSRRWWGES